VSLSFYMTFPNFTYVPFTIFCIALPIGDNG
jgi:hypothetical protein